MTRALVLVAVAACYRPATEQACTIACDYPNGTCPSGLTCGPIGRCTLPGGGCGADAAQRDAPLPDVPNNCFYGQPRGFFSATSWCPMTGTIVALGGTFRTDLATPMCQPVAGFEQYCIVMADRVSVALGVVAKAKGARPLLVVGNTIEIDGRLDLTSYRSDPPTDGPAAGANDATCATPADGTHQLDGGTGGAGGSFGGLGGYGGSVDGIVGGKPRSTVLAPPLRGGCAGGSGGNVGGSFGAAGASGGAVYLLAKTSITIGGAAAIVANGEGGGGSSPGAGGGGGGGSGGMIVLDTPTLVESGALVVANGGGGGGGAVANSGGGNGGEALTTAAATGGIGTGPTNAGGDGSSGGAGMNGGDGSPGSGALFGGGGGGGGAGFILLYVPGSPDTKNFSPPPS